MFEKVTVEEMKALMDNKIIKMIPRQQMMDHYQSLQENGIDAKREQLMSMRIFKRKRYPDGSLNKHKAWV